MILASFCTLCYILSMATYVLDGKTARIFAGVKSAHPRAREWLNEKSGARGWKRGEWDWA